MTSGGAPAASRKRKAAPEEHWSKKGKGEAFILRKCPSRALPAPDEGARGTYVEHGGWEEVWGMSLRLQW